MLGVTEALKYTLYKLMLAYFLIFGFALVFDRQINERLILLSIVVGPIIVTELLWPLWSYRHIKGVGKKFQPLRRKVLSLSL